MAFAAEQLGVDAAYFAEYGQRQQTVYEHAWEIYRDFAEAVHRNLTGRSPLLKLRYVSVSFR